MPRRTGDDAGSSSGSNHSEASSSGGKSANIDELIRRLHAKLGHEGTLSATDHLKGVKLLCKVRDVVSRGRIPSQETAIVLLCTGIALYRRFATGDCSSGVEPEAATDEQNEANEEEARQLIHRSTVLVFSVLCMLEHARTLDRVRDGIEQMAVAGDAEEEMAARDVVGKFGGSSLWDALGPVESAKRQKTPEHVSNAQDARPKSDWASVVVRASSGEIARHSLKIGSRCLEDETWAAIDQIAPLFFRNSASSMAETLLLPDGNRDYISLGTAAALSDLSEELRAKKLLSIVGAGESEAGQQVVRDLLLSFLLPAADVGVRRTLLLSREASTRAGVDHPQFVQRAHDVA